MCQYCKEPTKDIKFHRQETDSNISECYIHMASDGAGLFLRQQFVVKFDGNCKMKIKIPDSLVYADIDYCPFCGRKLVEDKNVEE